MNENIKFFLIKLGFVTLVMIFLYYIFSPSQQCQRMYSDKGWKGSCIKNTSW